MKKLVRVLVFAIVAAMMLSCVAFAEAPAHENSLIYGSSTEISGDWGRALWTNNASDNLIRNLIDDYSTIATNPGGEYVINETVVADYSTSENEDGSKTYAITLNDGLLWNDGTPITVQDFVASILFVCNGASADMGVKSTLNTKMLGGRAYFNGEAETLAGLRILDDHTFSITIIPVDEEDETVTYLPYYYDMSYAAVYPMSVSYWFGADMGIADDGEGCYFTSEFTADTVGAAVETARFASDNRLSAGPYTLVSFDKGSLHPPWRSTPTMPATLKARSLPSRRSSSSRLRTKPGPTR